MSINCKKCGKDISEETYYCPDCGELQVENMKDALNNTKTSILNKIENSIDKAKEMISKTSENTDEKISKGKDTLFKYLDDNPRFREEYNKHIEFISDKYDSTGTKGYVDTTLSKTSDTFDVISGQKMYDLVKDKLAIQDKYNDLLATKLVESLNKIKELEKRISELEQKEK